MHLQIPHQPQHIIEEIIIKINETSTKNINKIEKVEIEHQLKLSL
jgi:hypothetical protein